MKIFDKNSSYRLPYKSGSFDYILSNQTVYHLGNLERIKYLQDEFHRILKPKGRMIITLIGPTNTLCKDGREVEEDVYEYVDKTGSLAKKPMRSYVFKDENHIRNIFYKFVIDEIGWWDNNYLGINGFHWVVLCHK